MSSADLTSTLTKKFIPAQLQKKTQPKKKFRIQSENVSQEQSQTFHYHIIPPPDPAFLLGSPNGNQGSCPKKGGMSLQRL